METNSQKNDQNIIPNDADKPQKGVNVPNLRFKEFINQSWIMKKYNSFMSISNKRNIHNLNLPVLSASQEKGMILRSENGIDIKYDQNKINTYKIVNSGDYIVHLRSFQGGFAFSTIDGICSPAYTVLKCNPEMIEYGFFEQYFTSKKFIDSLRIVTYGIRDGRSISVEEFLNLKGSFPDKNEQLKIIKFYTLINKRINTQSKIIEDLELFKNMISYKILYNDKTACYKPLSFFSEFKNGYAFKSNTYSNKGYYQIITIANVSGNRYIDLTSSNKILNIPNDIQSHQILKINDILISLTGNVGRVSYCNKLNCLLNQRVGLLSIKNKDLIEYIFQCIHNKIFEKTMISRGQGVAQLNIGKNDIESFEIPVYS